MGVWGRLGYLGDSWNRLDQGCTNAILIFCHLLTSLILFYYEKIYDISEKTALLSLQGHWNTVFIWTT